MATETLMDIGALLDERKSEERINLEPGTGVDSFESIEELSTEKGIFFKVQMTVVSEEEGGLNVPGIKYSKLFNKPFKEMKPTWKLQATVREVSDLGLAFIPGFRELDGEARWTAFQAFVAAGGTPGLKVRRVASVKPGKTFVNVKYTAMYLSEDAAFDFSGFHSLVALGQIGQQGVVVVGYNLVSAKSSSGAIAYNIGNNSF